MNYDLFMICYVINNLNSIDQIEMFVEISMECLNCVTDLFDFIVSNHKSVSFEVVTFRLLVSFFWGFNREIMKKTMELSEKSTE